MKTLEQSQKSSLGRLAIRAAAKSGLPLFCLAICLLVSSCNFNTSSNGDFPDAPFSKREMANTKTMVRATAKASSMNAVIADRMACLNCRTELAKRAGFVRETETTDENGNTTTHSEINANIINSRIVRKEVKKDPKTGMFVCWVLMEMPR